MRLEAIKEVNKSAYLQIVNALRGKPDIVVSDAMIQKLDAIKGWPSSLGDHTTVEGLVYYKGVELDLYMGMYFLEVKLHFPTVEYRKYKIRHRYLSYDTPRLGHYMGKQLINSTALSKLAAASNGDTDLLYAQLEPTYKKYQAVVATSKKTEAEWDAIEGAKSKAIDTFNRAARAAAIAALTR